MKWSILSGDVNWETYGGKLISPMFNNGDFAYWFVIEVMEWAERVGEDEAAEIDGSHNVCLSVVAPSECPPDQLQSAFDSYGWTGDEDFLDDPTAIVDLLHGYGIRAVVGDWNSSLKEGLRLAKREAVASEFFFGFAMDRPQNAIGSTGCDLLRGDLTAGLQLSR
jgi:hypothetical protein